MRARSVPGNEHRLPDKDSEDDGHQRLIEDPLSAGPVHESGNSQRLLTNRFQLKQGQSFVRVASYQLVRIHLGYPFRVTQI